MAAAAGKIGETGKFEGERGFKVQKAAPYIKHRLEVWDKLYAKYTSGLSGKPRKDIKIELPDGTVKDGKAFETSPMDIARLGDGVALQRKEMSISKGLAESAIVAKAGDELAATWRGVIYKETVESLKQCVVADIEEDELEVDETSVLWDLTRPLEGSCRMELLKFDHPQGQALRCTATLLPVAGGTEANIGYDPFRLYFDVPVWGGWRELRDPITQRSPADETGNETPDARDSPSNKLELIRLNGLEEFLLLGDWQLFSVVPEKMEEYEDPNFHLHVYSNPDLSGEPILDLNSGDVVASVNLPKPGISEILLPDVDAIIKSGYVKYRWPPQEPRDAFSKRHADQTYFPMTDGSRYLQLLPTKMRNEDFSGMDAVVGPSWTVLPAPPHRRGPNDTALAVTETRDPRSNLLGWLRAGAEVRLHLIEGTRALLGWLEEEDAHFAGGWISVVRLDGSATVRRILEETSNQRILAPNPVKTP
ncbi:Threonine--tRNA ligase [Durusdinium trenchii]|uniref:Cytoplasmic (Threonyl-tRNA synthetase) (ThrRS) n=1 Tax=Durusdinium trenchii TaxID=1381693 RepID=A0ABP0SLU8_9DINO